MASKSNSLLSPMFLRTGSAWIFLILGVIIYCSGYFLFKDKNDIWREILIKVGDILVIGVLLGYLTNVAQLLGVFKNELQDIIYGREFLKERKDLSKIWETVSKELFKSKFPKVNKELLSIIHKSYFPVENVSYYENYNISIDLSWADKEKKIIKVKNSVDFDLIAESQESFEFPLRSWIDIEGLSKDDYSVKVTDYMVNNSPAKVLSIIENDNNGTHEYSHIITLNGDTKYEISKIIEKKYSIEKDFTICFKAQYIVNKMTVEISYPEDIQVSFISRGTIKDYQKMNTSKDNNLKRTFKGLLLPQQGYVIALREK